MALTQVSSEGIKNLEIKNADINASAAIAGTKIDPTFTSDITISNSVPKLLLTDTGNNPDYDIRNQDGAFVVRDTTNSANRLIVQADGRIDIAENLAIGGTSNVGTKLHIENASGDAHIRLRGSANYGILFTRHSDAALTGYVGSGNAVNLGTTNVALSAPISGGHIIFQTNGSAATDEKMRIKDNGTVGIGTSAPSELFTINGADQSALIRTSNAAGTAKLKFEADGTNYAGIGLENGTLHFRCSNSSSPTSRLRIGADGTIISSGNMRVNISTGSDGILGQAFSGYFGLKHGDQTLNSEYMIISNDNDTYISCSSGGVVRIRPSANSSSHELLVAANITLTKAAFGAGTTAIDPDSYTEYSGGFGSVADGGGWGARGMWIHGGGTGDAAAIGHNGSNLYFGIQNGSNQNTMGTYMMIEPTGDICMEKNVKLTGTVLRRSQHQKGHLEGSYNNIEPNSNKSNPIYTIGSSYNPNEGDLSNMYGIGFSHGNASFTPTGVGWGMYVAADGDSRIYLDGSSGNIHLSGSSSNGGTIILANSGWTGDKSTGKIQTHAGNLYMQNASNTGSFIFRLPNGNTAATIASDGGYTASDLTFKKDVVTISNSVDTIKKLIGRSFTWKEDDKKSFGVIAQEVETVLPELVTTTEEPEGSKVEPKKMVNYAAFAGHFIEAIKELATKVEALETEVAALKVS